MENNRLSFQTRKTRISIDYGRCVPAKEGASDGGAAKSINASPDEPAAAPAVSPASEKVETVEEQREEEVPAVKQGGSDIGSEVVAKEEMPTQVEEAKPGEENLTVKGEESQKSEYAQEGEPSKTGATEEAASLPGTADTPFLGPI